MISNQKDIITSNTNRMGSYELILFPLDSIQTHDSQIYPLDYVLFPDIIKVGEHMNPEDLSALKSIFALRGLINELANPLFTDNLDSNEKISISNLIKSILAELRQYQGSHQDIVQQIKNCLDTIPDLNRFDPTII